MHRIRAVVAMLGVILVGGAAHAGLYNLNDPLPQHLPPLPYYYDQIQLILGPLRAAAVPPLTKQKNPYAEQAAALESKAPGELTTSDRVNLGACYVRLNRPNDAVRVLLQADQSNFLVLANLAAAYQALNELDRALAFEEQALAAWPSIQPGWNGNELAWYRRAEGYSLKLLESRQRESQANPGNKPPATMDLLFGKPRSPAGDYEAQEQPWKLWGDLPPDAFNVVAQLLLWAPNDDRLYWQLGEILNSMGLVPEAAKIFDELSFVRKFGAREFMEHRRALKESLDVANALVDAYGNDTGKYLKDCYYLMLEITPRGVLSSPGLGDACNAVAPAAVAEAYNRQEQQQPPGGPPPPGPSDAWRPDWRTVFVGFAAGAIIATLAAFQWMEWRKRGRPEARRAESPPSPRTEPAVHDAGAFRTDDPAAPDRLEGAP